MIRVLIGLVIIALPLGYLAWLDRGIVQRILDGHDAAERDLTALADATREDTPLAGCIEKLPPRIARDPCGCLWFRGGLWSPCRIHDTGLVQGHLERWEQELSDQ